LAAALAVILFLAAQLVAQPALSDVDRGSDADKLVAYHDDPARAVILPAVFSGLSFLLLSVPLAFLFRAAANRSERMRRAWIGFCFLGPAVVALNFVLSANAFTQIADDFVDKEPAIQREAEATDTNADGEGEESGEDDPREERADDLENDSDALRNAQLVGIPGLFAFAFALIYTGLWTMRTGLLTRFSGSFAMALGVLCAIPLFTQIGVFGVEMWMIFLVVLFLRSPEKRPPAWAAGTAVPWLKPGEAPMPADDQDVEGSGRELSEPPLEEAGGADVSGEEDQQPGETQGPPRKKRKRRD
jgi:hypothetical protein